MKNTLMVSNGYYKSVLTGDYECSTAVSIKPYNSALWFFYVNYGVCLKFLLSTNWRRNIDRWK